MPDALILFAHGSRDPEWVRPFEALRASVANSTPGTRVELAYLERSPPTLEQAIRRLAEEGATAIHVLPLFLALGKHLRHDIPALARDVAAAFPNLAIEFLPALGETPEFAESLSRIAARAAGPR